MTRVAFVLLPVALLATLAGCGRPDRSAAGGGQGKAGILRYPIPELTKLDPAMVQDGDTIDALHNVYEGLVGWNEKSEVVGILAQSWTVSPDGRTYIFKLKDGIKFNNGRAVTADDFKWSIERTCDPKLASPTVGTYLADIVGVKERIAGQARDIAGYKVVDRRTVAITLDKPRPYFLGKLTYLTGAVVAKEAIPDGGEILSLKAMVGTGPFVPDRYEPGTLFTMKANPAYHGGAPKLAGIERPIIKDAQTRLAKYKTGGVDLTRIERQDIASLKADTKIAGDVEYYTRASLYYVGINCGTLPAFKDRKVRRAIAMAIDRKEIVEVTLGGANQIANGIIPPGVFGHRDGDHCLPFDPEKARALLREAGVTPASLGTLTIYHRDGQPDVRLVAEKVAGMLKSNLQLEVKSSQLPWSTYLDRHNKKELDFFHMRWGADYLDAQNFLSTLLAGSGPENKINYSNPAYDALCAQADTFVGPAEARAALYGKAEDMVIQDAPFVPLYFQRDAELVNRRVKGMRESVFGHLPHTTTSVDGA